MKTVRSNRSDPSQLRQPLSHNDSLRLCGLKSIAKRTPCPRASVVKSLKRNDLRAPAPLRQKAQRTGSIILLFLLLLLPQKLLSQTFPVQLSTQLLPPFSGYLSDYASPGNDNLRLFVLFNDFSHPSYDVKFKIRIEGQGITIQSASWFYAGPFNLVPGVPQMLSGTDLADLLNENNLEFSGISRQQYDQRKVLPEGFYTITITAYDYLSPLPVVVSNEAITQAWMVLNDPPLLNFPACGSELTPVNPQQIAFSWTPMNLSVPASALGTEYTFELWEIFPANTSPGTIVQFTAPLFSVTTSQTLISYGMTEPPLVIGREYVWRVRSRDNDNRELFRNNGYSPLCTFTWGNENLLLGNIANLHLDAQALSHRMARCSWDSLTVYASYRLQFRKTGSTNWFALNTDHASMRIADLEANTDYEAQVEGVFPNGSFGPWSNLGTWHTLSQPQFNCGESSAPPALQNFHPLTEASTGMIWQVGQFEMVVLTLSNTQSGGGWYSGTGKITAPLGITMGCTFNGVQIGDDHVLYNGEINAMTDGVSNWLLQYNPGGYQYDTSWFFSGNIDSIYVDPYGNIVIIDANGNSSTLNIDTSDGLLITDSNGDQWIVNPDGTVTFVTGGFLLPLTNDTLNAQEMRIMKLAMTMIRNEISPNAISQKQSETENSKTALSNFVENQRQMIGNAASPPQPLTEADSAEFISYYEIPGASSDPGYTLGNAYKTAETDYYSMKVLTVMAREDAPDSELHFIGQYLTVNGILFRQYVAQQLAQGKTEQQIAEAVKENGIKTLVLLALKKQMKR